MEREGLVWLLLINEERFGSFFKAFYGIPCSIMDFVSIRCFLLPFFIIFFFFVYQSEDIIL